MRDISGDPGGTSLQDQENLKGPLGTRLRGQEGPYQRHHQRTIRHRAGHGHRAGWTERDTVTSGSSRGHGGKRRAGGGGGGSDVLARTLLHAGD